MKKIVLLSILLLFSTSVLSQAIKAFDYYRIESKVGEKYSAIETEGVVYFTLTSFIIKSNNGGTNAVFIIEDKLF